MAFNLLIQKSKATFVDFYIILSSQSGKNNCGVTTYFKKSKHKKHESLKSVHHWKSDDNDLQVWELDKFVKLLSLDHWKVRQTQQKTAGEQKESRWEMIVIHKLSSYPSGVVSRKLDLGIALVLGNCCILWLWRLLWQEQDDYLYKQVWIRCDHS